MKKRKILAILLASALSVSSVMPAFAADIPQAEEISDGQEVPETEELEETEDSEEILLDAEEPESSEDKDLQTLVTGDEEGGDKSEQTSEQWTADDFTYEDVQDSEGTVTGAKITGLSESGVAKRAVNPNMVMPDETPDGKVIIAIADGNMNSGGLLGAENEPIISVVLPGKLEIIGANAFRDCGLEQINFPKTLKEIGNFAFMMDKLKEIILPDNVTTVGSGAFTSNYTVEKVKISNKMDKIPQGFIGCSGTTSAEKFTEIIIPDGITEIGNNAFAGNAFAKVEVPGSVKKIGNYAFSQVQEKKAMTEIILHEGLESIGSYAFRHVLAKKVKIPSTIKTLNMRAFNDCASDGEKVKLYTYNRIHIGSTKGFVSESDHHTTVWILGEDIANAESKLSNAVEANYTASSWSELQSKLEAAKAVDKNTEATVEEVMKASNELKKAMEALTVAAVPDVKVSSISLSAISKKVAAGKKINMTVTVAPANADNKGITWKSSNTKYATVSQSGVVTVKKAGAGKTVTITATANDGSGKSASYKFSIMKDSVKKIVAPSKKTVKAGKKIKLKATVKTTGKKANKKLKWTSSNKKYATVSSKGVVTTKKAGKGKTVKITATSTDGSNKKKVIKIKIK